MLYYLASYIPLKTDRRAVTALEYGLIAALIAAVIVAAFGSLGTGLTTKFSALQTQLTN